MRKYEPEIRWHVSPQDRRTPVAVFEFDFDECEAMAAVLHGDGWARDLLDCADRLRELAKPDPDAPGLTLVLTYADGTQVYV